MSLLRFSLLVFTFGYLALATCALIVSGWS